LQRLAHYVVRNEILCEHFVEALGISRYDIGAKARELDAFLKENTGWRHNRFPALFPD